jgi:hypothetical protein
MAGRAAGQANLTSAAFQLLCSPFVKYSKPRPATAECRAGGNQASRRKRAPLALAWAAVLFLSIGHH